MSTISGNNIHNERKGRNITVAVHAVLIILSLMPLLTYPDPPPGEAGIVVNLGIPDVGQGEENAGPSAPSEVEPEPTPTVEPEPTPSRPEPTPQKPVVTTEDPAAVALRKQQQEHERRQREEQARQRAAEEEARRKAAAEEARRNAEAANTRNQIGGLFGGGSGKGNTGTAGNQGDPNGDPNSGNLEGISKGSGRVGGGLGNRGVVRSPSINDSFQKTGTVVVEVCVNSSGEVTRADLKLSGTTTQDAQLVNAAKQNARQWKFSAGSVDNQCGTITYNFRVQ